MFHAGILPRGGRDCGLLLVVLSAEPLPLLLSVPLPAAARRRRALRVRRRPRRPLLALMRGLVNTRTLRLRLPTPFPALSCSLIRNAFEYSSCHSAQCSGAHVKVNVFHVLRAAEIVLESAFRRLKLRLQQIMSCVHNGLSSHRMSHLQYLQYSAIFCAFSFPQRRRAFQEPLSHITVWSICLAPSSQLSFTVWLHSFLRD